MPALSVLIIVAAMEVGRHSGLPYLLFPEFGALVSCVLSRPSHVWACSPVHLATTPAVTGVVGILVLHHWGDGVPAILLTATISFLLIGILRSPILPALSSGILPLMLHVTSWSYPPSVLISCTALACVTYWRNRRAAPLNRVKEPFQLFQNGRRHIIWYLGTYLAFLSFVAEIAKDSDRSIILFPPLAVLGFEILVRSEQCPWGRSPLKLLSAFFLSATAGLTAFTIFGESLIGVALAMGVALWIVERWTLYVPPAIAVSLLPFVMGTVGLAFPAEITISVALLLVFLFLRKRLESLFIVKERFLQP